MQAPSRAGHPARRPHPPGPRPQRSAHTPQQTCPTAHHRETTAAPPPHGHGHGRGCGQGDPPHDPLIARPEVERSLECPSRLHSGGGVPSLIRTSRDCARSGGLHRATTSTPHRPHRPEHSQRFAGRGCAPAVRGPPRRTQPRVGSGCPEVPGRRTQLAPRTLVAEPALPHPNTPHMAPGGTATHVQTARHHSHIPEHNGSSPSKRRRRPARKPSYPMSDTQRRPMTSAAA